MAVIAVVVVVLIVAFFIAAQFSGSNDPFRSAAAGLGLELTRSVPELLPSLEGMVNGIPVRIDIPKQGAAVRYRIFYPPLGMALRLERETTISRTMGELGQADTQVGEATFDNTFKVSTSRPDALREMMTPELRRTLVRLLEAYPRLVIEDGGMTYVSDTADPGHQEIVRTTTELAAAAHQLVSRRPPPLPKPQPGQTPRPQAKKPTSATSGSAPQRTAPPGSTTAASPPQPAAPAQTAAATPVDPAPTPAPLPAEPPAATGLPAKFFEDAFGANRLSFETDGSFENEYRGKTVSLTGRIKQVREVEDDTTVDVGPSTKATVTVARINTDLYGKTDIDAIAFFPRGTADKLSRGQQISFTGTLDTIDPFMRNLFVVNARLRG